VRDFVHSGADASGMRAAIFGRSGVKRINQGEEAMSVKAMAGVAIVPSMAALSSGASAQQA